MDLSKHQEPNNYESKCYSLLVGIEQLSHCLLLTTTEIVKSLVFLESRFRTEQCVPKARKQAISRALPAAQRFRLVRAHTASELRWPEGSWFPRDACTTAVTPTIAKVKTRPLPHSLDLRPALNSSGGFVIR